jgi:hypothetical protein
VWGRAHNSVSAASAAASKARPIITNAGLKSATAMRVAGSVKPKITHADQREQQGLARARAVAIIRWRHGLTGLGMSGAIAA